MIKYIKRKFALKKFKKECLMLPCTICPNFRQYDDGEHDKWTNDYCAVAKKYGLEK